MLLLRSRHFIVLSLSHVIVLLLSLVHVIVLLLLLAYVILLIFFLHIVFCITVSVCFHYDRNCALCNHDHCTFCAEGYYFDATHESCLSKLPHFSPENMVMEMGIVLCLMIAAISNISFTRNN